VVINFRDVTERKIAEDALEELNRSLESKIEERTEQLRESNAALESFAYMAAHDLQAPLRVMSGYATILSKAIQSSGNEDNISLLKGISDSSKKMSVLINDLLCFSRISHSVLQKEELDLNVIVSEEIDALMLTNMSYLDTEIRLYGLGSCYCDQQMVRQVWQNLLSNAMKYSHKVEKPMVEIGYTMSGEEKVYYVRDNGAGFEQKNADKIFQAFKRLHSSDDFEGTGIGLATVRNIIERHGGKVWAASEQGLGATFYFTLPV
jgi:light-regulated signal transduction histidine kinase (bacteriophytochrome)